MTPNELAKNEVLAPDATLKFPTAREQSDFQTRRTQGLETYFRVKLCEECQKECPKPFECCSEVCYNKRHPKPKEVSE